MAICAGSGAFTGPGAGVPPTWRIDASLTLSNHSWDVGAGVIVAREAGAVVLDLDCSEHATDSTATIAMDPRLAMSFSPSSTGAIAAHSGEHDRARAAGLC